LKISIVIPCHNEEDTVAEVIERVKNVKLGCASEILVVDDGSTDNSRKVIEGIEGVRLIVHENKRGKGATIKTAMRHATGDVIVVQDADLEYFPENLPRIIAPIKENKAKIVYGSRFLGSIKGMSIRHRIGNIILTLTTCLLYFVRITDVMTGHKAFVAEVLQDVELQARGFGFEVEFTGKILGKGYKIYEVPILYEYRQKGQAKISWRDGFKTLFWLIKSRFKLFT